MYQQELNVYIYNMHYIDEQIKRMTLTILLIMLNMFLKICFKAM